MHHRPITTEPGRPRALDRSGRARRTLLGAGATALLVAGGVAVAAGADDAGGPTTLEAIGAPPASSGADGSSGPSTTTALTPPPGLTPVSDADGAIAGYLREADERQALDEGEPPATLGTSEVDFRALPVVDEQGEQVGWFLSGSVGFVSLADLEDPAELARIEQTWLADQAEARADGG